MTDSLAVFVELDGRTVSAGTAHFTYRGTLSTSFQYDQEYLRMPGAYALDPSLPAYRGRHHVAGIPGAFSDCAPDIRNIHVEPVARANIRTSPDIMAA